MDSVEIRFAIYSTFVGSMLHEMCSTENFYIFIILLPKRKYRKLMKNDKLFRFFFIACKFKVLWPKVEAMRNRLFMTSLNFSLNQMIRLNKWILLQFYRITSVIYELLQWVRFSIQKFWPSQMYHFLWNHCKLVYFISNVCDAFRMCKMDINVDDEHALLWHVMWHGMHINFRYEAKKPTGGQSIKLYHHI